MIDTTKTMKEYLFASGILERGTEAEIADAKKAYRQAYLRRKQKEHRAKNKTVCLSFPHDYTQYLEDKAVEYTMSVPLFLKACIDGYLRQVFILPNDRQIKQVEIEINRIGNNINQLVRHCHRLSLNPEIALNEIQGMLIGMDATVASYLRTPQTLDVLVKKTLEEQPEYITQLQRIMNAYAPKDHPASRKEHQTITQIHD
jgi:Bacterial mobilisation protein (MobC).